MAEHLFREEPPKPLRVTGAHGSRVRANGKRYLDFLMGWCVGNAGWNKREILRAVRAFKGPVYVDPQCEYEPWERLAKQLAQLTGLDTCFRATGGTEAVELALKISRAHNRRKYFMAFDGPYHGQSLAALGLVGIHQERFGPYPDWYIRLRAGDWERSAEAAVKRIKRGDVCAFIAEPVICNLGVLVPPTEFYRAVREACEAAGTVFIMDEVATGFGRTGKWFGFQHHKLKPDIVTVAKGFSSGYGAIGATIARADIAEGMRFPFSNYSTFGWHPIATATALANIAYIKEHGLVERSAKSGTYLKKRLEEFAEPEGRGLCLGFPAPDRLAEDCRRGGLLIHALEGRAVLFPALDVTQSEMDRACAILGKRMPAAHKS